MLNKNKLIKPKKLHRQYEVIHFYFPFFLLIGEILFIDTNFFFNISTSEGGLCGYQINIYNLPLKTQH